MMFGKIKEIEDRFEELERELSRPEIIQDQKIYQKYLKEHGRLLPIITTFPSFVE